MKAGWIATTLGDACELYQPQTITKNEMDDSGPYPVFGANGIIGRYREYNHENRQLVVGCRGSVGAVHFTEPKSWITGNTMVVCPRSDNLDLDFLRYALLATDLSDAISGTAQPQITRQSLSPIELSYPQTIEEQRRIVAVLDQAFARIAAATANAQKNLANARALFESQLNDIIVKCGLDAEPKQLADYLELITYGFTNPMPTESDGPYMVTAKNVTGGRIDYENTRRTSKKAFDTLLTDKSRPLIGDVLLTKDGTLGRLALVDQAGVCINQSVALLRCNSLVAPKFLLNLLSSRDYQSEMISNAGGTTIKHIYITRVDKMLVRIPDNTAQLEANQSIEDFSEAASSLQSVFSKKLAALAELKRSLLQKAFAGELTQ